MGRFITLLTIIAMLSMPGFAYGATSSSPARVTDIEDYIEATDAEEVTASKQDEMFGTCRIIVNETLNSMEGASEGASYEGTTILKYDTPGETEEAYEKLIKEYGPEKVIVDIPLFSCDTAGWGTEYMNMDHEIKKQSSNKNKVTVAVLDTGINSSHEIFKDTTISNESKNIINGTSMYADDKGHGTMAAGIIAESTPSNVEIMAVKTMNSKGEGTLADFVQGVEYATAKGADVINLSLGVLLNEKMSEMSRYNKYFNEEAYIETLENCLRNATEKGVLICASSGNNYRDIDDMRSFPACSEYAMAVGAINKYDTRPAFSNYGDSLEFCAPGTDVLMASHNNNTGYKTDSGTSFACPYIAACCAYLKMDNPDVTMSGARETLKTISVDLGDKGWDPHYGYGMPRYEEFVDDRGAAPAEEVKNQNSSPSTNSSQLENNMQPTLISIAEAWTKGLGNRQFTGKNICPAFTVFVGDKALVKGKDYTLKFSNNRNAGKASVVIKGKGVYTGSVKKVFTIIKAKNTLTAKGLTKKISYKKLRKKSQVIARAKAVKVTKARGKVSYTKLSVNKKKYSSKFTVNSKTGKVTVKKRLAKGTYKIRIKVKAAGTANYKTLSKTVTLKVKVI